MLASRTSCLLVLGILAAGCLGAGPDAEGAESDALTSRDGPVEKPWDRQELFNDTVLWPATPLDGDGKHRFDVPPGAERVEVVYNRFGHQPGGYQIEARALLVDAEGETHDLENRGPVSTTPYACANAVCGYPQDKVFMLTASEGTWTVSLEGYFTADVKLQAFSLTTPAPEGLIDP
jgi:hypothetical protein